ncbi:unnamed protein product [Effrenium voratum]|nr:unnamed protein product [Effrenium voratum]
MAMFVFVPWPLPAGINALSAEDQARQWSCHSPKDSSLLLTEAMLRLTSSQRTQAKEAGNLGQHEPQRFKVKAVRTCPMPSPSMKLQIVQMCSIVLVGFKHFRYQNGV